MQLIASKIIPARQNVFWDELPGAWQSLSPRACLVLTTPYEQGAAEQQTLMKMLGACRLTDDQYHILALQPGQRIAWHKLHAATRPKQVLLLGIDPKDLGIQALFRIHEPNHYSECVFIPSLAITALEASPEAKKEFWAKGLKPVFAA